jgi:predicted aspartyl protease
MSEWLNVKSIHGQRIARQLGAIAALWLCAIAAIFIAGILRQGIHGLMSFGSILEIAFLIASAIIARILFRRSSVAASLVVLAMVVSEVVARVLASTPTDFTIPLMAILFSIQAVRGSIAAKKQGQC